MVGRKPSDDGAIKPTAAEAEPARTLRASQPAVGLLAGELKLLSKDSELARVVFKHCGLISDKVSTCARSVFGNSSSL